ncbi:hypothetical protein V2J09_022106 [Rumex salicifolius]
MTSLLHRCRYISIFQLLATATLSAGESPTCLTVYKEGGAPAVFKSPKCPRWKLPKYDPPRHPHRTSNCQTAMLQGRRSYQEDRILCALDVRIPFPGPYGLTEVQLGILAVFDGHNGAEASDMASKLLMEYLVLHTYFLLDATFASLLKKPIRRLTDINNDNFERDQDQDQNFFDQSRYKVAWTEASKYNLDSGSTATVILIADDQILVANLGDSKALICSENDLSPADAKAILLRLCQQKRRNGLVKRFKECGDLEMMTSSGLTYLSVKELTRDHRPNRDDEKSRVEKYGGYVVEWGGVPRINGQLSISRAIGDVSFKSFGVTSAPEVTDWQPLTANDSYLVAASDGVFETLDAQDVCDLLWEAQNENPLKSKFSPACSYSLADCVVNTAFEKGSRDNIASIVVPLKPTGLLNTFYKDTYTINKGVVNSFPNSRESNRHGGDHSSALVHLEHAQPLAAKLHKMLVEAKQGSFSCFYLSENLKENEDSRLQPLKDGKDKNSVDLTHALLPDLESQCGGSLNLYNERSLCLHFGTRSVGDRDHSLYPDSFVNFFGLLESIPFYISGSNFGSFEHVKPSMRYILNRRFGRGAYGEVWLAFHWNCSVRGDVSSWNKKNRSFFEDSINVKLQEERLPVNRTDDDCDISSSDDNDDNMFILKRIMVERGTAVYLSGLREKYFGEIFSNASAYWRVASSSGLPNSLFPESIPNLYDVYKREKETPVETEDREDFKNLNVDGNTTGGTHYEEGLNHVARYVESFESRSNEIWLVFRHEGFSLSKLMYTAEEVTSESEKAGNAQILSPSKWWHWLKTTKAGQEEMRYLVRQLLMAVKSCHDRNITHRDIKPDCWLCKRKLRRIIDFGSAIDDFTIKHLYNSAGPTRAEQTFEYTPPEALLNSTWYRGPTKRTLKYDMWSIGVVIMELILGSPDVFQISTLSRALLDQHIEGWNEELKELAYKLRSFMEMCILITGSPSKLNHNRRSSYGDGVSPASWKCSEEFFSNLVKSRDPLHIGFPDVWAMRLVRQLLLWDPDDRLSVDEALQHPYFHPPQ